jgi:hypothetical protein
MTPAVEAANFKSFIDFRSAQANWPKVTYASGATAD